MATKPTRQQQQAADNLAESLVLIAEAARLDGKGSLDREALRMIADQVSRASSVTSIDEIIARALERRARSLGLPSSAAEWLTLLEYDVPPLETLLLSDEEFQALIEKLKAEIGED